MCRRRRDGPGDDRPRRHPGEKDKTRIMNTTMKKNLASKSKDTTLARGIRVSQSFVFRERTAQLESLAAELGLSPALGLSDRTRLARQAAMATDPELEAIAAMADKHGGSLAGIALDADLVRETIAYAAASLTFEHALEQLLKACGDERLRRRARVAVPASAIRRAVNVIAGTALGRGLEDDAAHLRSLQPRRRRKKDAAAALATRPATSPTRTHDTITGSG